MSEIRQIVGRVLFPIALLLASGAGCVVENPRNPGGGYSNYDAGVQDPGSSSGDGNDNGNGDGNGSPSDGDGSDDPNQPGPGTDAGGFEPGDDPEVDAGTTPDPDSDAATDPGDGDGDGDPGDGDDGSDPEDDPEEPDIPRWDDRPDQGVGNGSDVITMGDSWMHNTLGTGEAISGALKRLGKRYRNYAQQGVMLLEDSLLFGKAIPKQFDDALRQNRNIKTVIMTAGGNDIIQTPGMQADCRNGGDRCKQKLREIGEALKALWAKMAAAGVQDVVHIMYATDAGSSGDAASDASKNGILEICNSAPLNCHLLETTSLVRGQYILDGIHPTRAANDRMAKAILELMEKRKVRR